MVLVQELDDDRAIGGLIAVADLIEPL